jgi:hypothetical protein
VSIKPDELLFREEIMWRQRARIDWLKEGDQNRKFFHRKASGRASKNIIKSLKRNDGSTATREEEFVGLAHNFFSELYTKDQEVDPSILLEYIPSMVTREMNNILIAEFIEEEIGDALFQIGPLKAPGSDGLHARFFQRNWELLKSEICKAIKQFFDDG